ncbi:MAG: Hsp20/alpha crystallin family protein [Candidatus Hodarchaeales archaeon]|jgi:HSP20 family molecular chaperone IbpA
MSKVEDKKHVHVRWIHACVDCGCNEAVEEIDGGCTDEDHYHVSFEIPGVKKEDIELKLTKESYKLQAKRFDGFLKYISEGKFACDVSDNEAEAIYNDGLLKITVPYECPDPMKEAIKLPIN